MLTAIARTEFSRHGSFPTFAGDYDPPCVVIRLLVPIRGARLVLGWQLLGDAVDNRSGATLWPVGSSCDDLLDLPPIAYSGR